MGDMIRRVSRTLQTAMNHDWEREPPETDVIEYMYDPRNPLEFYVYPPNNGYGVVRAVYAKLPTPLQTLTQLGNDAAAWGDQVIPIDDVYVEALAHFVLHRAFSKDAEWALNPEKAKEHFTLYLELLATKTAEDAAWSTSGSNA